MPQIDQFESVFKAAEKTPFVHEVVAISKVLVITDLNGEVPLKGGDRKCESG